MFLLDYYHDGAYTQKYLVVFSTSNFPIIIALGTLLTNAIIIPVQIRLSFADGIIRSHSWMFG